MKPVHCPFSLSHRRPLALCLLAAIALTSCNSEQTTNVVIEPDLLQMELPDRIRQVRELDLQNVEAVATVNNQQLELARNGEQYRATISVDVNSSLNINVLFRERLADGGVLNLANYASTLQIGNTSQTLQLFDDDFNHTSFDDDNDQISNLVEREEGTDPFLFDARPENRNISIFFGLPRIINEPQVTQVIATIAGTPRAVRRDGNDFEISGIATTRAPIPVEVILLQRLSTGQTVVLADATRSIPTGAQSASILLTDNDFNFDKDQDGDGKTNLQELQNGSNPFFPD